MDVSFTPLLFLNPFCDHNFHAVGPVVVTWTSTGTDSTPPEGATRTREHVCSKCGGSVTLPVGKTEERAWRKL